MRGGLTVHGTTAVYARTLRRRAAANMLAATFAVVPVTLWWADHPTSPLRVGWSPRAWLRSCQVVVFVGGSAQGCRLLYSWKTENPYSHLPACGAHHAREGPLPEAVRVFLATVSVADSRNASTLEAAGRS